MRGQSKPVEDFDIHRMANRTRPHSHQMYRGAFRITPQSLRSFQSIFDEASNAPAKSIWMVFSAKDEPRTVDSLDDLLTTRNPPGNPIWGLFLNHVGTDVNNRLFITSADIRQSAAIQLSTDGDSSDKVSAVVGRVRDETRNIRLWYWLFRWVDDFLRFLAWTHGRIIAIVFLTICCFALVVGGIGQFIVERSHPAGATAKSATTTRPQDSTTTPLPPMSEEQRIALDIEVRRILEAARQKAAEQTQRERELALSQLWRMLTWCGTAGVAIILFFSARYLFPRVVFEIGEGKERYQRLCNVRSFVMGTVLLSGFLIPWVRQSVFPSTPTNGSAASSQPGR